MNSASVRQYFTSSDDELTFVGVPNGDAVVPPGFSVLYVLTQGRQLRIHQVNTVPEFTLTKMQSGFATIHTLVYDANPNSPNFLDLSIVDSAVTTGGDVVQAIANAGICADLDVEGARFVIKPCRKDAGTLTADASPVALVNGEATISATPDGNARPGTDFATLYVLTSGSNLIIEAVSATPSFTVTNTGLYTIHTLVYDDRPMSPDFLDLSVVNFGVTPASAVLDIVAANKICASLDVAGAPITVSSTGGSRVAGTLPLFVQPNPVQTRLEVQAPAAELYSYRVHDIYGKLVEEGVLDFTRTKMRSLDTYQWAKGIYLLSLQAQGSDMRYTGRIIKE